MVKKLFKHEFLAYARVMAIVYSILLTIATATRIILIFENDTTAYRIISTFSLIIYGVSVFTALIFSFAMGVVRFYRNLFTAEGYLTFTLPVTAAQHITVKAVTAVCVEVVTLLVVAISGCIVTLGEVLTEVWKALVYVLDKIYAQIGGQALLIGGEFIILLLLASFTSMMMYYVFISIGQLSKKNRILAAVGAYFAYYIITQVLSTIITIVFSVLATTDFFEKIGYWITQNPFESIHIGMWGGIALSSIFALIEFFVIRSIITKKLNLE